jgi:5-carboxyvanillate decarboxylase
MSIDRRTFIGASTIAMAAAGGAEEIRAGGGGGGTAPRRVRRIAVEEAFAIPEQIAAMRALAAGNWPSLDLVMWEPMLGDGKTPTLFERRLIDLDGERLEIMDATGVDMHLLSLTSPGPQIFTADAGTALARLANDRLAEAIARHPSRYAGLASIAPQDPARAARELERAMRRLRLNGVIINSHTNGEYLDQPKFWPILEAAEALDAPIYIHPRSPNDAMAPWYRDYGMWSANWGFQAETGLHAMRIIMSAVLDRFPQLKIVLGHMGEGLPYWIYRIDYTRNIGMPPGQARGELKPSEYLKRNFAITSSGVFDPLVLDFCCKVLSPEHVLFAIDYPYQRSEDAAQFFDAVTMPAADFAKVSHGNAERIFHIAPA